MVNSFGCQLHQQCALGLKSTLTGLSLCPKNGTDNKQILKRQCHVNYFVKKKRKKKHDQFYTPDIEFTQILCFASAV